MFNSELNSAAVSIPYLRFLQDPCLGSYGFNPRDMNTALTRTQWHNRKHRFLVNVHALTAF